MSTNMLSGEQSNTKLVAIFKSKQGAEQCAEQLQQRGFDSNQLAIIAPHEKHYSRKLEPEQQGVKRTAIRSHVVLGAAGFVLAWLIWGGLYLAGVELIVSSPIKSLIPILFFCTAGGLMLGGFVTMRVDHQAVIQEVDEAVDEGYWSLVMHSRDHQQTKRIEAFLKDQQIEFNRTL
ncbi:hypothetical protein GCM10023337_07270 [Paenalcaligenes hermetiae]|mgnify:FL=1|uniref:DUF1269 domain-containing protein n=2 Tax=Paenalcaligenes hermetiae TaxID=1157987 RepID=A0ABP9LZS6_9BURK